MIQNFSENNIALRQMENALSSIGYHSDLLVRNYEYADTAGIDYKLRNVVLAGFAQTPPSFRNACIGVVSSNGNSGADLIYQNRALGAPLFFEITPDQVNRWKVTEKGLPEFKETISFDSIANVFEQNKAEWQPDRIFRAKVIGDIEETRQLDFFDVGLLPLLEGMLYKKLDGLLRETLAKIENIYKQFNSAKPKHEDIYRIVFRFIIAKVMRDRSYPGDWGSNDAVTILKAIEKHYRVTSSSVLQSAMNREEILNTAWKSITNTFLFQNLSVDDLAFIYENTLITSETRKIFGTHSTPPRVVEYIVNKLPFEEIPEQDRYVLEPCAGHGGFLIAAMRRLRELLPEGTTSEQRHKYLVERLAGIEIDPFAAEVCWSRLVLADYPNSNGWKIYNEDIFQGDILNRELKKSQAVLCNPPYESFSTKERAFYNNAEMLVQKPAELLRRILKKPPSLLGLVLPRVFEEGLAYRKFHKQLAEIYGSIELVALPEVFNYSHAVTTLILASEKKQRSPYTRVTCRKIAAGAERELFLSQGTEPSGTVKIVSETDYKSHSFSLWIPPLSEIWDYLSDNPVLGNFCEIHRGLEWIPASNQRGKKLDVFVSDKPLPGYLKGYVRTENHLLQYTLKNPQYLSLRPEDQLYRAHEYQWNNPKVVCNAARLSVGPWRIGAVADAEGLAFSNRFIVFWPSKEISIFALSALLNSPLCNAFLYSKEPSSLNRVSTIKSIPLPSIENLEIGNKLDMLSQHLSELLSTNNFDQAKNVLLQIDAEILRAYDLPPALERELLDTFQGIQRPIPFEFTGYYPEGFKAYFPLYEIISEEFENSRAESLLKRMIFIKDPQITEVVNFIREGIHDE